MMLHIICPHGALQHPRRAAVLAAIEARPGLCFRALARATGIPAGTLRHHVTILARVGAVREIRNGSRIRYAAPGLPDEDLASAILDLEGLQELYDHVQENEPVMQKDIVNAFHRHRRSTVQHRLGRLSARGVLRIREQGRCRFYSTEPVTRALQDRSSGTDFTRDPNHCHVR